MPSLIEQIDAVEAAALAMGSLMPLEREDVDVTDGPLPFRVTWTSSLSLKDMMAALAAAGPAKPNPFDPPDEELVVCDLGANHQLILNKFQMEPRHVLVITKGFREQQSLIGLDDCQAVASLLSEMDALVMFNGGKAAGGSQDHRHFHFMPACKAPLDPQFTALPLRAGPQAFAPFDFPHAVARFEDGLFDDPDRAAAVMDQGFAAAASVCGVRALADGRSSAYDVLLTRRWMIVAPRTAEFFEAEGQKISINALHYGGRVGVRQKEQLEVVRRAGLHALLKPVTGVA